MPGITIPSAPRRRGSMGRLCLLLLTAPALAAPQDGGKRVALIVGNDAYSVSPLKNAVNDARAMDKALRSAGFTTKLLENVSKERIGDELGAFTDSLGPDDSALFYYAGHAFQIESENFLVPVDFKPASGVTQAKNRCVSLAQLFEELKRARTRVLVVILDACRGNPIAGQYSHAQGLAEPLNAGKETYIAFSTAPNQVATDNPEGKNSWFTEALADFISQPGLTIDINEIFNRVRKRVEAETEGRQAPWSSSSLSNNFYFHPPLKEDMENDPTLIERWMQDARRREQREDWPEAIELVNQALKKKPLEPEAKSKLPYLIARRDAQANLDAANYAKAADLYELAFQLDSFSIEAAFQAVNSHLLNGDVPAAVHLLKAIRVRGTSDSVRRANAALQELAAVYPEAGEELRAGIPQPPPIEEVFGAVRFGIPDWDAGGRYLEAAPVGLTHWAGELTAAFAPPAATATQVTAATTTPPSDPPTTINEHAFQVEVISVGATRELDYSATGPLPTKGKTGSAKNPKPVPEFGYVEFEGPVGDASILVDGNPAPQIIPGKLQLPVGTYEIRTVRDGKIVFRQQNVEVKPSITTRVTVK